MAQGVQKVREHPLRLLTLESGGYLYIGQAEPGTLTSEDRWRISRKNSSTLEIRWAKLPSESKASADFNKVWDNVTSYTYE
jgi:hypothetical protein